MYHIQFSSFMEHAGQGNSSENGGGEGDVGVYERSVLSVAVVCDS